MLVGAAFWMFIAAIVVASIIGNSIRHRESQNTIRQAIDKGQPLDPETLERLLSAGRNEPRRSGLIVGGCVLVALSIGLVAMGWFGSQGGMGHDMFMPSLGIAAIVCMLGVGLLFGAMFIRNGNGSGRR
jgi:hypothetical protein